MASSSVSETSSSKPSSSSASKNSSTETNICLDVAIKQSLAQTPSTDHFDGPDFSKIDQNRQKNELETKKTDNKILKFFHIEWLTWARCRPFVIALILILYNIFWGFAIHISWHKSTSWCHGVKLLSLITIICYSWFLIRLAITKLFVPWWNDCLSMSKNQFGGDRSKKTILMFPEMIKFWNKHQAWFRIGCWSLVLIAIIIVIGLRVWQERVRLYSIIGYFGFILIGFAFSKHRKSIKWNQVLWGLTLQVLFGIFVLRTRLGRMIFLCISEKINTFLNYTNAGTEMVFGYLATTVLRGTKPGNYTIMVLNGTEKEPISISLPELPMQLQNSIFAMTGMPVIIFFSFIVSILYYYGVMQLIVEKFGIVLQKTIGTTACESISASGNIFLGMSESPLLIAPFIPKMTKSELHTVMAGGFSTIAGSVMAAYISFGISASSLLSASVMAAPTSLALSKLFYPETETSRTQLTDVRVTKTTERSAIEAGSNGAVAAIGLIANILANLIAFVACLSFLDSLIGWFGAMIDLPDLSFKFFLSKLFVPIALMLGVELNDASSVAGLIGVKIMVNEFVAYQQLSQLVQQKLISERSQTIVTFALCGFANLSSIGIQVGTLSALAPNRKPDLVSVAFRAMITGSVASFMTACVAGMLV